MPSILIVEDDKHQRKKLIRIFETIDLDIRILEASTGKEAIDLLKHQHIDLFFLDIQLPDMSGMKIAEEIRKIPKYELTYLVFITTHIFFQLEAFKKFHCYDFIEKPYKSQEILDMTLRLLKGIRKEEQKQKKEYVAFELKHCIVKVVIDEIIFVESQRRNCIIHTKQRTFHLANYTMKQIIEMLNKPFFIQTHKSYIVNLQHIQQVEKVDRNSWLVYFNNYSEIAHVSNKYKSNFTDKFLKWGSGGI